MRRHIGHHLEEIALAALPPDIYQLGDEVENSSADSQTSPVHGMENNNANRLAPPVNVIENSDVESLVTSTHGVENSSANPPPPLQPPLVLSYEPTGDEALAEKIDYLGNILDGTSSVGRVAGSVENSSVKPPSPLQPPLVLSYESARHEALAERIDYLGNILDGTSSVGRVAGSVEDSSVKPPSPLQPSLTLSYEPAWYGALAERIGYLGNILDDSSSDRESADSAGDGLQREQLHRDRNPNNRRTDDRTCYECNIEFPFTRDLKSALPPNTHT